MDGVFPGRPQNFRHQCRPVDDCSPGREGMTQDGETRGGTFHDEMDRCRKSRSWNTASRGMSERDGNRALHGGSRSSTEAPWRLHEGSVEVSMEVRGGSMEVRAGLQGAPWSFMEVFVEVRGVPWRSPWRSLEVRGGLWRLHGGPWRLHGGLH